MAGRLLSRMKPKVRSLSWTSSCGRGEEEREGGREEEREGGREGGREGDVRIAV